MESGSGDLINVGRNQSGYAVIALKKKNTLWVNKFAMDSRRL